MFTVFNGVFGPACTYGIFRNVYTVVFDSSIHTVLTHAILNAKTATAETFQLVPYLIKCVQIIILYSYQFLLYGFQEQADSPQRCRCKGLKQQYMAGQLEINRSFYQPILLLVEACSGS